LTTGIATWKGDAMSEQFDLIVIGGGSAAERALVHA
jgi:succinate dehydrogenase/fumarate reductase flavoprotein subunit